MLIGVRFEARVKRRGGGGRRTWGYWKRQIILRLFNSIDLMMTLAIIVVENLTQTNNWAPVTRRRHQNAILDPRSVVASKKL